MSASPEGVGPVWQLTAVDTATRYAIGALVAGDKSARDAASFVDHVAARLAGIGVELTGVLTDNGPEFTGRQFTAAMTDRGLRHHRIPPRSPNHNAVCERFQGTALQEFYRPAVHRQHFARLADLAPSSRVGCSTTTPAAATTATLCAAARPLRSWRRTYHDQAEDPSATTSCALEALVTAEACSASSIAVIANAAAASRSKACYPAIRASSSSSFLSLLACRWRLFSLREA
jgi:hypothetical protein